MKMEDFFPSRFLKADDFPAPRLLTISKATAETIKNDDGETSKAVLWFEESEKGMVLNKTNSNLIPVITGARTAGEAKGKQVVVYDDPTVSYGGRAVGGLRLKKVPGAPRAPSRAPARPMGREPGSDDDKGVPFDDELPPM